MKIKGVTDEDFLQYKEPSMVIIFPFCDFKCDRESGNQICQNWALSKAPIIEIETETLVQRYLSNNITKAVVCAGLEPMDSFDELIDFVSTLRSYCDDTVIVFTGYRNNEIEDKIDLLSNFSNIIIKFGRFLPGHKPHFDSVLGINLASENQYAVKIS